jgi:putative effector of murein hydrolase
VPDAQAASGIAVLGMLMVGLAVADGIAVLLADPERLLALCLALNIAIAAMGVGRVRCDGRSRGADDRPPRRQPQRDTGLGRGWRWPAARRSQAYLALCLCSALLLKLAFSVSAVVARRRARSRGVRHQTAKVTDTSPSEASAPSNARNSRPVRQVHWISPGSTPVGRRKSGTSLGKSAGGRYGHDRRFGLTPAWEVERCWRSKFQGAGRVGRCTRPQSLLLLIALAIVWLMLRVTGVHPQNYAQAAAAMTLLLAPITVALAVPTARRLTIARTCWIPAAVGAAAGGLVAIVVTWTAASLLAASHGTLVSLVPRSTTVAVAVDWSGLMGGIAALTALVTTTGAVFGAMIGVALLEKLGVRDVGAIGLALGVSSHGIGAARALSTSETACVCFDWPRLQCDLHKYAAGGRHAAVQRLISFRLH